MVGRREGSGEEFVGKVSEFGISSQFTPCFRSLSENLSLWFSVSPLCLCGESFFKEFHHRDTEHHRVLHREMLFPTDS